MLRKNSERKMKNRTMQFVCFTRSFLSLLNCFVKQSSDPDKFDGDVERNFFVYINDVCSRPGLSTRKH
jgi:hypothetical protein